MRIQEFCQPFLFQYPKDLQQGMFWGIQMSVRQNECPVTWNEVCKPCLPEVGVTNRNFNLLDVIHERCLLFSNLASHWPIYSLSLWDGSTHPEVCTCALHSCGWFLLALSVQMPQWDIGVLNRQILSLFLEFYFCSLHFCWLSLQVFTSQLLRVCRPGSLILTVSCLLDWGGRGRWDHSTLPLSLFYTHPLSLQLCQSGLCSLSRKAE